MNLKKNLFLAVLLACTIQLYLQASSLNVSPNISIALQEQSVDSLAKFYNDKTWEYITKENDSALYFANKGIAVSREAAYAYGEIINLEYRGIFYEAVQNDYEAATKDYLLAIAIAEKEYPAYLPDLYISMGILFAKTGDDDKAISYLQQSVNNSDKESRSYVLALVNLAIIQSRLGDYQTANTNFEEFLKIEDLSQREKDVAILGIGKNLTRQKKFSEATPYYLKAIALDSLKGAKKYAQYYSDLIDNYVQLKNAEAIKIYLPILSKSYDSVRAMREKQAYYTSASRAYRLLGNTSAALQFQDSLLIAKDSLAEKRYSEQVTELETKYQTQQKELQIEEAKERQQLWYYIAASIGLGLLLVIGLLYNNIKKRKELSENKQKLEHTLKQRNMLLRETHHRVKNSFQMVSSLLQLQATETKTTDAVSALDAATQRVNSMILLHQQLYAKDNLLGVNLKKYIDDLTTEILQTTNDDISIVKSVASIILDIETATSIGLLVNELALNSSKYAWPSEWKVKKIFIEIEEINGVLKFQMKDNGEQIKSEKTSKGYGSELIEVLIERLDAKNIVEENSFAIVLEIPIPKSDVNV